MRLSNSGTLEEFGLKIKIKNTQADSPIKILRCAYDLAHAPVRFGDHIRAYYLKAEKVITKYGFMGQTISSYFVPRQPKKEEWVEKIEILNDGKVVATYGSIKDRIVKLKSKEK